MRQKSGGLKERAEAEEMRVVYADPSHPRSRFRVIAAE